MADVTAEHEGVSSWFAIGLPVGDEGGKRHPRKLNLLTSHFAELGNDDFDRMKDLVKIGIVSPLIPVEERRIVDKIFDQEIAGIKEKLRRFCDLIKRGDR